LKRCATRPIQTGEDLPGLIGGAEVAQTAAAEATGGVLKAAASTAPNLAVGVFVPQTIRTTTKVTATETTLAIERTTVVSGTGALTTTRAIAEGAADLLVYKDIYDFGVAGIASAYCAFQ
jgi:hypothetical protein